MEENIARVKEWVENLFLNEGTGHDWWHIKRVVNNALSIAKEYPESDKALIELAALVHDVHDYKIFKGTEEEGKAYLVSNLVRLGISHEYARIVEQTASLVSFKGACVSEKVAALEAQIVQDADRLDAIGAIGIARTFAFGGSRGQAIYDPEIDVELHQSFEAYKKSKGPTINHFYEKLLLLKDRMNTDKGKELAEKRHEFMLAFLDQFYEEWNNKA